MAMGAVVLPVVLWMAILALVACRSSDAPDQSVEPVTPTLLEDLPEDHRERLAELSEEEIAAELDARRAAFTRAQEERIARHNQRQQRAFQAIGEAGGVRSVLRQAREDLAIRMRDAPPQFREPMIRQGEVLDFLLHYPCSKPAIFEEVARFPSGNAYLEDIPLIVEPTADTLILGCTFGAAPGQVKLIVNPTTGGFLPLDIEQWADDTILARLPPHPGYMDQPAQLVVVAADGTKSDPVPVQFVARRVVEILDPTHPGLVHVLCADGNDRDECLAVRFKPGTWGPTAAGAVYGNHYEAGGYSDTGTDRWFFKLQNGWSMGGSGPAWMPGGWVEHRPHGGWAYALPDAPKTDPTGSIYTSWYGKQCIVGEIGHIESMAVGPSTHPDYPGQEEMAVGWWVGHVCSELYYLTFVSIIGPEGVPYWDWRQ